MNKRVLDWLHAHKGKTVLSPRRIVFGREVQDFEIINIDEKNGEVMIRFTESRRLGLPLTFLMFDRALNYITENRGRYVRLGTGFKPQPDTIEGEIWKKPHPISKTPYKAASHICDILVLSEIAEYGYTINPLTGRKVQGVKQIYEIQPKSPGLNGLSEKEFFLKEYKETILKWTEENENAIIEGRASYSWNNKSLLECIDERNKVSQALVHSRIRNRGGVDLETADKVMEWGGFSQFPLRDSERVLSITSKAFNHLDKGDIYNAIFILMTVRYAGISKASKLLGLFDQNSLCIYDSRVGTALRTLKHESKRIVLCPPGRSRKGDTCTTSKWAENYKKLIWTLEVISNCLNVKGYPFTIADVEMALFMIGR